MPKFATHFMIFGQDKWVMKHIENAYPHFDRIYIAYGKLPWGYNPDARKKYVNTFDLDVIRKSKFNNKITIIEGDWLKDEEQRNACYNQAKKDGMDYLMIRDADEFYSNQDFIKMKDFIIKNPDYDVYRCAWYCFWKTFKYILVPNANEKIVGYPEIFANLNKENNSFKNKRTPFGKSIITIPDVLCYHGAYVFTNEELFVKLKTWSHSTDFNTDWWYNNVWLKWNETMINIHPINPSAWYKAIPYNGELPEILKDYK
jgi:hypothetical protein